MKTKTLYVISLLTIFSGLLIPDLSLAQTMPKTKDDPKAIIKSKYRVIKIADGYTVANLYKTDSTKSKVLKSFKGGERVKEIETKGTMMKVTFGDKTGWIVLR